ncbi:MAG: hypothetical protein EA379_04530 [Phycisphaerales bacterium]|nr:MAG: hypothetical protein EA379_04530 [Phycisphaerales bacterium]
MIGAAIATLALLAGAGTDADALPEAWVGAWVGETRGVVPGPERGEAATFRTELRVGPTDDPDRFTWTIIYGEGELRQVRAYELMVVDRALGRYAIDEKNSIVIDVLLVEFDDESSLRTIFEVGDVRIVASYTLRDGALEMEFSTYGVDAANVSGGEGDIPEVRSYTLRAAQRGVLRRGAPDGE